MSTISEGFTPASPNGSAAPDPQPAPLADEAGVANLDKVRDILFGSQMREYDRRFARLEERLVKETTALGEDVRRRLAALEEFVRRETESLAERIKGEHDTRTEAAATMSRELQSLAAGLERRTGALDDQLGRAQRDLRQQMLEQYQRLSDEMRQKTEEVLSRVDKESTDLRSDKADRATIATLLTEMALRLRNELTVPGFDGSRGNG